MTRRSQQSRATRAKFAAAVVEHGDWRQAAETTGTPLSTAREWMAQLGQLFRSPTVVAGPAGAPVWDGPLVGADNVLESILHAFEQQSVRCVSLVGPIAVGKTRLAMEAGRRLRSTSSDIVFVSLAEATTRDDITRCVCTALGMLGHESEHSETAVAECIRQRGARGFLLVLDAADLVRDELPPVIHALLAESAYLEVIVTSCGGFDGICGREVHAPPLPCPPARADRKQQLDAPAVQLFIRAAGQGVRHAETHVSQTSAITRALDGLPGHIVRAAQRTSEVGFEAVLAGLESPLSMLDGDRPRAAIRDSVERAWSRLCANDRAVIATCAAFMAPFDLAAATIASAHGSERVQTALHNATSCGLVVAFPIADVRHFQLLRVGREIAQEHAHNHGTWCAALERHADYYSRLASDWIRDSGRLSAAQRAAVTAALPDLRAACRRAGQGLVRPSTCVPIACAMASGSSAVPFAHARSAVDALLTRSTQLSAVVRASLLLAHGKLLRVQGLLSGAVRTLTASRRLARECASDRVRVEALIALARAQLARRRVSRAKRLALQSFTEARELGDPRLRVGALICLSHVEIRAGGLALARQLLDDALVIAKDADLWGLQGQVLNHLGGVAWFARDAVRAEDDWRASLQIHSDLGDELRRARVMNNLAALDIAGDNSRRARAAAEAACGVAHAYGDPVLIHAVETVLVSLEVDAGNLSQGVAHAQRAVAALQGTELHYHRMLALTTLGAVRADSGLVSEARADLRAAQAIADLLDESAPHLSLTAAHIALAEAKDAGRSVLSASSQRARDRANEIVGGLSDADDSLRLAAEMRTLKRALDEDEDQDEGTTVVVHTDGAWFQLPYSVPVDLSRRPLLSKIVRLLASRRIDYPGQPVAVADIIGEAWPTETRSSAESLRNRLYVAIARLRKLGLKAILVSEADGYLFSPTVNFEARVSTRQPTSSSKP